MKTKIAIMILVISTMGCAHTAKKVDQEISTEPPVKDSTELSVKARALINSSTSINPEQKTKLLALQEKTTAELKDLQAQSLKIRSLLIQEVTGSDYNEKEIWVIKNRLKKNESQKLLTYFNAVDEANKILGRDSELERRQELMHSITEVHDRY